MKRWLIILWVLCLVWASAGAEGWLEPISASELPADQLQVLAAEKQQALIQMPLVARGAPDGYSDSRSCGALQVDFSISASRVYVGQKVNFEVDFHAEDTPLYITYSGLVMDADFRKTGDIPTENFRTYYPSSEGKWSYIPDEPGYFCFVMTVADKAGNRVSFHTNTIQVLKPAVKLEFSSKAVDGVLTAFVTMDRKELSTGETITASCSFVYDMDPIRYTGSWLLYDEQEQATILTEFSDMVLTGGDSVLYYDCTPTTGGEIVFRLEALDGEDNRVLLVTPGIPVKASTLSGDADGDGEVNIYDALAILQYAVGWEVTVDQKNADVTGDGQVDIYDALLILQYSVGWDVELL